MTAYRSRSYSVESKRIRARRKSLLVGCAVGAFVAFVGHAEPARAQAVINATPSAASGSGTVTFSRDTGPPTPHTETVTVEVPSAVVNWTPTSTPSGTFEFLPAGNTLTFQNGANVTDFTVLNRILTTVPSRFDGHVVSQLRNPTTGLFAPGGTVLFSSPGGIIVGATAVFDVGSLVLTALNASRPGPITTGFTFINFNSSGGITYDQGGFIPDAAVVTEFGSQINSANGGYVAFIAPQIIHGGSVRADGSVAYIAAEQVDVAVNQGLFDIVISAGTTVATPITHNGSTGGPASTGAGDNQAIYMVAAPRSANQAITMLLGGSLGYDAATDVSVENGAIVLSAGYNVRGGSIGDQVVVTDPDTGDDVTPDSNISIQGGTYTSDVVGQATGDAIATASTANPLQFDGSLQLQAGGTAELNAAAGATANVDEDLDLIGIDAQTGSPSVALLQAGEGATITVGGDATVRADALPPGFRDVIITDGADRVGGTASVLTQGGAITIGGDLNVTANAAAQGGTVTGGNATGGTAVVEATGGSIDVTGDANVFALALGGASPGTAGNGQGGIARVSGLGGAVSTGGTLYVNAGGVGGQASGFGAAPGTGTGGTATLEAIGAGGAVEASTALVLADGGQLILPSDQSVAIIGPNGAGRGGTANVSVTGGSLTVGTLFVSAGGIGGPGADALFIGNGLDGFSGTGGTARVQFDGGSMSLGGLLVVAAGTGGDGGSGFGGGNGGTGTGGLATVTIANGTPQIDDVIVAAGGFGGVGGQGTTDDSSNGGAGGSGGNGFGGDAEMIVGSGGSVTLATLEVDANGGGGDGGAGGAATNLGGFGGRGGNGTAGSATLRTTGGSVAITDSEGFLVLAEGFGGNGGAGGDSFASGPAGDGGDGGDSSGGTALIDVVGGSVTSTDTLVDSTGFNGIGGTGGTNDSSVSAGSGVDGNGSGGLTRMAFADGNGVPGSASLGAAFLLANGSGANGGAGQIRIEDTATGAVGMDFLLAEALGQLSLTGPTFAFTSSNGPVEADSDVTVDVVGDASFAATGSGGLRAGGLVDVGAGGSILFDHQSRAADAATLSGGTVNLDAGNDVTGSSDSLISASVDDVTINSTNVDLGRVTAARDISIVVPGDIAVVFAQAGDDFVADGDTFTGGTIVTTGLGEDTELDTTGFLTGSNIDVFTSFGLRLDNGNAFDKIRLRTLDGNIDSAGLLDAGDSLLVVAGVDTGQALNIDLNGANAGTTMELRATGNLTGNTLTAGGDILALIDGVVDLGSVISGGNVLIDPTDIFIDSVTADGDVTLIADGNIDVGAAQAGDDFAATAGGTFTGGTITVTGLGPDSEVNGGQGAGSNIIVVANGDLTLDNGTAPDTIDLTSQTGSIFSNGTLSADTLTVSAAGELDLNNVVVVSSLNLSTNGTPIDGNSFTSGGDIVLNGGDITLNFAQAGDDFVVNASSFTGGTVIAGPGPDNDLRGLVGNNIDIFVSNDLRLDNGTAADNISLISVSGNVRSSTFLDAGANLSITAGSDTGNIVDILIADARAGGTMDLRATGGLTANDLTAGGDIVANLGTNATVATIDTGGSLLFTVGGIVDLGTVTAANDVIIDPTDIIIDSVTAGGDIDLTASNDITVGFAQAGDDFTASAGNAFTGGTVIATGLGTDSEKGTGSLAGGNIVVTAGADLRLDNGDAANDIRLSTRAGSIFSDGLLTAGGFIFGTAPQDIDINDADAGASIFLNAGGFIDTGDAVAGSDVALDAGGNIAVASAQAGDDFTADAGGTFTGGTVTVTGLAATDESSGPLVGNNIVINANNDLRLDNGTAPDRIDLTSATGSILGSGTLTADQLLANAALDILINDVFVVSALNLTTPGGSIGGNSFNSSGNINLDAANNVTVNGASSGGSIVVTAVGNATLGTFAAAGSINVNSAALSFTSATAGTDIILTTSGNMSVGTAQAGDDFIAISNNGTFTGGSVTTTGAGTDTEAGVGAFAGSNIFITANGDLRLDNGSSPGRIGLGSSTGSILSNGNLIANRLTAFAALNLSLGNVTVTSPLTLTTTNGNISGNIFASTGDITLTSSGTIGVFRATSGGNVVMRSVGNLSLDQSTATGRIDLASSTADVLSGGGGSDSIGTLTAGGDILANAARDVFIQTASAGGNIDVDAGRNATLGNATAGGSVLVDAIGTARFTGSVGAPTISVGSADIDIAAAGFGNSGTQLVSLTVRPTTNQTVLGGTTQGPGYTLTDPEADRITAVTLRVTAPATGSAASRPADLLVRDLSVAGQQVRTLQLVTPGIAEVNGNLLLSGVQTNGGINIQATERLQVVNPTGSIRVRDGSGLTAGSLNLTSNNIWSATQAILTQLLADSNFAGRDAALLQPSGSDPERGSIEGGTTTLTARDTLFVQNSGTPALFSGITVRQNTLTIVPTGSSPLRVFAFGRRINPDGTFVTNTAFFREVVFQTRLGTPGYTSESQFNRCFINSGACAGDTIPGGQDIVEEPVESTQNIGLPGEGQELVDTSFAQEALIEEPVTSGADSIQWDCDTDDDGDCDEDDVNG